MTSGRSGRDGQTGRIVARGRIEAIPILAVGEMEFLLFRGGGKQSLDRLDAMTAQDVTAIGGGRDHRRDRDDRERDHDFDQGEAGGGASFRHEVFTGSPA